MSIDHIDGLIRHYCREYTETYRTKEAKHMTCKTIATDAATKSPKPKPWGVMTTMYSVINRFETEAEAVDWARREIGAKDARYSKLIIVEAKLVVEPSTPPVIVRLVFTTGDEAGAY